MDVGKTMRRLTATGIIAAAGFAVVPGQARADGPIIDINLPVTVCGIQLGVLGSASGDCPTAPQQEPAIAVNLEPITSGEILEPVTGILEDPTVLLNPEALPALLDPNTIGAVVNGGDPIVNLDVPVNVCGNAVGVLTDATSQCPDALPGSPDQDSTVSGNVQVNVCGNGIGVLAPAGADCEGTGTESGNGVGLPLGLGEVIPAGDVLDTVGSAVGPGRVLDVQQIIEDLGLGALVDLNVEANICGNGAAVAEGAGGACPLATPGTTTPPVTTPPTSTPGTTTPATTPATTAPTATTAPGAASTNPGNQGGGGNGGGGSNGGNGGGGMLPSTGGTVLPLLGLGTILAAAGVLARRASRARRTLAA